VGDLRLLALPVDDGRDRYCVTAGRELVVVYAALEPALAAFGAVCAAADGAAHRRRLAASGVVDLTAYRLRRRRPRGGAAAGPRPAGAEEP
jgi:hypothetical protein